MPVNGYYLETWGCQMNVLDSELVAGRLRAMGYEPVGRPDEAALVVLNTCSVRQHAEDKVLSRLGELGRLKRRRPGLIIAVIGCMAQRAREALLEACPQVDVLCGPGELHRVPALIADVAEARAREDRRARAVALTVEQSRRVPAERRNLEFDSLEALDRSRDPGLGGAGAQAYIRVQRGCDKFCTFCVVPFTRGPERSRPPSHIVEEARRLADRGVREVTLLGQTINSYVYRENGQRAGLADLLERVAAIEGIRRVRFITSYPGDWDVRIFEAMRDIPEVCEYLHIPAQSGSDAVLRRMKRQYSVGRYEALVGMAREMVPGISLAGDFIVGFCGETEEDFEQTVGLVERVRYKNIFVFKYSDRPGTAAHRRLADDVPEEVKRRRNHELLRVQAAISLEENQRWIGRRVEVLVEGPSKAAQAARRALERGARDGGDWRDANQLTGRTRQDHIVVFSDDRARPGEFVEVEITAATALTLHGDVVRREGEPAAERRLPVVNPAPAPGPGVC